MTVDVVVVVVEVVVELVVVGLKYFGGRLAPKDSKRLFR